MKKFIAAILALVYMTTSTGATIHMHYCMGKLADWSVGHNDSKTCSKCGMEKGVKMTNGCCNDEQKFFKSDADQKISESTFQALQLIAVALPASLIELAVNNFPSVTEQNPTSHAPPRSNGIAIYIRNRTFRI